MGSAHGLYITTISPLVCIPVYDSPLESIIWDRRGSASLDDQPNSPHIFQTPRFVCHYGSEFPPDNL